MPAQNIGGPPPQPADSAGQPWEGRQFAESGYLDDDGTAPAELVAAIAAFRAGDAGPETVVTAFRDSRLLIPLVTRLGESEEDARGRVIDKTQELSIVTVAGPDGRAILPVFSSAETMRAWKADARPVPADAARVAVAAAEDGEGLVVLDPGSATEFVLRRPAVWSLVRGVDWVPCWQDEAVAAEFARTVDDEPAVVAVELSAGDPHLRLAGPELVVTLILIAGLDRSALDGVLGRLQAAWAASTVITEHVDAMRVSLRAAA